MDWVLVKTEVTTYVRVCVWGYGDGDEEEGHEWKKGRK